MWPFLAVILVSLSITVATTPLVMRLAWRLDIVQHPERPRDIHPSPIPRIGGLALVAGFLAAAILSIWLPVVRTDLPDEFIRLRGLLIGCVLATGFGLIDDRYELPPAAQFAAQFVLAGIAIGHLIFIEVFTNPLTNRQIAEALPWWVMVPLTLFWFLGTMNTVNWLDGLDGLASGVVAIASAIFAIHMLRLGQDSVALLALALLGATVGFLPFNFNPARTFMGTTGTLFLGYALAALSIMAGAKVATMLLVLGIPILDVAWQIIARIRRGSSPFRGDRGHLHHRLYDAGLSQRQVVVSYWGVCALLGAFALLLPAPIYKLIAILIFGAVAGLFFVYLARVKPLQETPT